MAKNIIVKITCDRCKTEDHDGVDGTESVSFGYDGYSYGLDLCARHAEAFRMTMQDLIATSTERERLGSTRRVRSPGPAPASPSLITGHAPARRDREQLQAVRVWAQANGFKVSNNGRIPAHVDAAFQESFRHSGD